MMNKNHGLCSSSLKLTLLVLLSICLNGCVVTELIDVSEVRERMKPESIICGKDGTVALKVTSTYCRYSLPDLFVRDHLWFIVRNFSNQATTEGLHAKEVSPWFSKPRERYLILKPSALASKIKHGQSGPGNIYVIRDFSVLKDPDYPDYATYFLFGFKPEQEKQATVIPKGFWAQNPDPGQIPASLVPGLAIEHKLDEPIPIMQDDRTVYASFSGIKLYSGRHSYSWWGYPIIIVLDYAPQTITNTAFCLVTLPFTLPRRIFSSTEDTRFSKPHS